MGFLFRSLRYYFNTVKNQSRSFVKYCDEVPKHPHFPNCSKSVTNTLCEIDLTTVRYLERLSLVNFGNYEGIKILESSIRFAEKLVLKDTEGVEPLSSVLENRSISLREDAVIEGNCRNIVMSNAKVTEEEYFVAPPGNIPLEPDHIEYKKENIKSKILN